MTSCYSTICNAVKETPLNPVALYNKYQVSKPGYAPLVTAGCGVLAAVGAVAAAVFALVTLAAGSIGLGIGLVAVSAVLALAFAAAYVATNYLLVPKAE